MELAKTSNIIQSNWKELNLGDSAILKARIGWQGLTTAEYLDTGNYYLITGTDFKNGFIDWDNCVFVEKNRYDQDRNIQVQVGDVLVTKDGTIGKVAFVDKVPKPTTLNSGVFVIRPRNKAFDTKYFYYVLMSNHFADFLSRLTAGSTISHLYQKDFVHFNFPLPSLPEQKAIAQVLSDTDNLIQAIEQKLSKKRAIKQGAMQQLLTPKEDWEVKKMSEIVKNISSGNSNTSNESGSYNLYGSTGEIGKKSYYDYSGEKLLVARVGANAGNLYKVLGNYCVSDNTLMLSLDDRLCIDFLFFFLKNFNLNKLVFGSGQPLITGGQLKNINVPIPNLKEQIQIATILSDMDAEIEQLEQKLSKYKMVKQGLMQNLLTGKIRLV